MKKLMLGKVLPILLCVLLVCISFAPQPILANEAAALNLHTASSWAREYIDAAVALGLVPRA